LEKTRRFRSAYDAIVIGGGISGLTAALELAHRNMRVLLLEQQNKTGGRTGSFVRGRYEFDVSRHELCTCGSSLSGYTFGSVRSILENCGVYPDFVRPSDAYRIILTEYGVDFTMPFGIENAINAIEKVDPGQGPKVRKYFKLCEEIYNTLLYLSSSEVQPGNRTMAARHASFLRTAAYSVEEVYRSFDFSPLTKNLLSAYPGSFMNRLDRTNFIVWAMMMYLYIRDGGCILNKTSHALAVDLEARIRELNGQVETNVRVSKLITEGDVVVGIQTAYGDQIRAGQVFSSLAQHTTYPERMNRNTVLENALKLTGVKSISGAPFAIFLGLDALPKEMGIFSHAFFFTGDMNMRHIYNRPKGLGAWNKVAVTCPDVVLPCFTGPDRCQLSFTCLYEPDAMSGQTDPARYQINKEAFADVLINQFELITGAMIRSHIEEIEIATPSTYAHYSGEPGGAICGYDPTRGTIETIERLRI
jgi:prolycopene isomerase